MKQFRTIVPRLVKAYNTTNYDPNLPKMTLTILKSLDRSIREFNQKLSDTEVSSEERKELESDIYKAEVLKKMFLDPKLQDLPPYVPPTPQEQYEKLQNMGIEENEFIPPGGAVGITENHRNKDGWKVQFTLAKNKTSFLKTQNDKSVIFPNEISAVACMGEWETQKEYLRSTSIPLTNLFCKVQDMKDYPGGLAKVKHEILEHFTSGEHICHREGVTDDVQEEIEDHWDPIVEWFNKTYDTKLRIFDGDFLKIDPAQPEGKAAFEKHIDKLTVYELAAIHEIAPITESIVVAIALVKGHLDYNRAFHASQLLTIYNTNLGGLVYGDHDILFAQKTSKMCTVQFFLELVKNEK